MNAGIVVVVTGGRNFAEFNATDPTSDGDVARLERELLFRTLNSLHEERTIRMIVHGACTSPDSGDVRGADAWAQRWAVFHEVPYIGVPALWKRYAKTAGPVRNSELVKRWVEAAKYAVLGAHPRNRGHVVVVAFPGGDGTADLVRKAEGQKLEVIRARMPEATE